MLTFNLCTPYYFWMWVIRNNLLVKYMREYTCWSRFSPFLEFSTLRSNWAFQHCYVLQPTYHFVCWGHDVCPGTILPVWKHRFHNPEAQLSSSPTGSSQDRIHTHNLPKLWTRSKRTPHISNPEMHNQHIENFNWGGLRAFLQETANFI